jgi:hypothetical protein
MQMGSLSAVGRWVLKWCLEQIRTHSELQQRALHLSRRLVCQQFQRHELWQPHQQGQRLVCQRKGGCWQWTIARRCCVGQGLWQ